MSRIGRRATVAGTVWLASDTRLFTRWPSALGLGAAAIAAPGLGLSGPQRALLGAGPWLNTPPLGAKDLRGKVVLVNFWTYTCINSLRPLPYVRAWAAKYKDRGLVVIGVHTPEFGFERDIGNVRRAVGELGVSYPVVLDSDYAIWRAFDNQAWPAFYFIGADGRVRRQILGEGGYDQSERLLQTLLAEARGAPVVDAIVPVFGEAALMISPRVGHLHITVDDLGWHWADASDSNTVDIVGLTPGPHEVLIELVDAQHHRFPGQAVTVAFTVPAAPPHGR